MRFVISYDITDDRRRARAAAVLLDFGARIQESVFVATLDDELQARLLDRLRKVVDEIDDKVHLFPLCQACGQRVIVIGKADLPEDQPFYIV